jgi:D-alanine-D-alanine ligase-like ATP-grasp enzyme
MAFAQQARPFQLFGFDFMLDTAANAHLLEVNGSPAARELLLPSVAADIVRVLQVTGVWRVACGV